MEVQVVAAYPGPVVTRYEIEPATGVKGSQIVNLSKDLARSLALVSIRGRNHSGQNFMALELPNPKRQIVRLSEIIGSQFTTRRTRCSQSRWVKTSVAIRWWPIWRKCRICWWPVPPAPGKSVGINTMILSLLYRATPEQVRLILIDPKMLEMSVYEGIPHLLCPVVTDMRQAGHALNWTVGEMERRYKLMSTLGARNLAGYNKKLTKRAKGETFQIRSV